MVRDMTKGSPFKLLAAFWFPLLVGNLFQQVYSLVDSVIVGRFVGVEAFAGISATGSLNFLILGLLLGILAFGVLAARLWQLQILRHDELEGKALEQQTRDGEQRMHNAQTEYRNARQFVDTIRPYAEIQELDAPMLNTLIDHITVAEPEVVNGELEQAVAEVRQIINDERTEGGL